MRWAIVMLLGCAMGVAGAQSAQTVVAAAQTAAAQNATTRSVGAQDAGAENGGTAAAGAQAVTNALPALQAELVVEGWNDGDGGAVYGRDVWGEERRSSRR